MMKKTGRAAAVLGGAAIALALSPAGAALAQARTDVPSQAQPAGQEVFVQTDNLSGNQILVFDRHPDGRVSESAVLPTGGLGGQAQGSVADRLASQGSLVYDPVHRLLLAVNAGSGTISVFSVDGNYPRLRQVLSSGGYFPNSIAVSGDLVYVLDAGGDGAVSGFRIAGDHLVPIAGSTRSLGLGGTNPPNFLKAPGQVGFSPDGSELIVTTKASTSSFDVFTVGTGGILSSEPVVTPDPGNVPFAFTFAPGGQLVATDAAASALHTYSTGNGGALTSLSSLGDGQKAACWVTAADGYYFVANAGSSNISGYTVSSDGGLSLVGTTGVVGSTDAGDVDLAATPDGANLYVEAGAAGALDEYHINPDGTLASLGSVDGIGAGIEGIATD